MVPEVSLPKKRYCTVSILILSSHLRLDIRRGLVPWGYPTKTVYSSLINLVRARRPVHIIVHDLITLIMLGEVYKLW